MDEFIDVQNVQKLYLGIFITSDKCPKCPFHLYKVEYLVSDFCDTFKVAISILHHQQDRSSQIRQIETESPAGGQSERKTACRSNA